MRTPKIASFFAALLILAALTSQAFAASGGEAQPSPSDAAIATSPTADGSLASPGDTDPTVHAAQYYGYYPYDYSYYAYGSYPYYYPSSWYYYNCPLNWYTARYYAYPFTYYSYPSYRYSYPWWYY